MNRLLQSAAVGLFVLAPGITVVFGQLPIPVPGQTPAPGGVQGGRGGRGGRGAQPAEPVKQVVTPIPTAIEITGPGEFFETFMDDWDDVKKTQIPAKETYAKFNYEAIEYFVSGATSAGAPYKTRIVVRKPKDNAKFNGLVDQIDREVDAEKRHDLIRQTEAIMEENPPLLPVAWEKINDVWYNYVKGHNPYDYFGIYDVVREDTFWLDKA